MTLRLGPGKGVRQSPSLTSLSTRVSSTDSLCTLGGESDAEPRQTFSRIAAPRKAVNHARSAAKLAHRFGSPHAGSPQALGSGLGSPGRVSPQRSPHSGPLTLPVDLKRIPLRFEQPAPMDWPGLPDEEDPWFFSDILQLVLIGMVVWALSRRRLPVLSWKRWSVMRKLAYHTRRVQVLARYAKVSAGPVLTLGFIVGVAQLRVSHLETLMKMCSGVGSQHAISNKPADPATQAISKRLEMPDAVPIDSYTLIPADIYTSLMAAARRGVEGQHLFVGNRLRLASI